MQKGRKKHWSTFYWKQTFFKFFLKYMYGFLVILVPCVLIVFISWNITRDQVINAGQLHFSEGMSKISTEISKMRILNNDIQNSSCFQELSEIEGELPFGQLVHLIDAKEHLTYMHLLYDFSPIFFVLFENNDLFLSSSQCDEHFSTKYYGRLMEAQLSGEVLGAGSFKELVMRDTDSTYSFVRLDRLYYYTGGLCSDVQTPILCVVNKSHVLNSSTESRMCYILEPEALVNLLLTAENRIGGFVRITDINGNVLLDYGNTSAITPGDETILDVGTHWMLSTTDTLETGWLVQVGIPKDTISEQIHLLYKLIYFYVVFGMLMVVVLAYIFGRRQYQELRNFYSLIPEKLQEISEDMRGETQSQSGSAKRNEYQILSGIFQHMAENSVKYLQLKRQLEEQNQAIRLEKLIIDGIHTPDERAQLIQANMFDSDYYCLAVVRMLTEEQDKYSIALMGLLEYLRQNWPNKIFHIHTGIYDELFVFSLPTDDSPDVNKIQQLFESAVSILQREIQMAIGVGISTIGTDISNLKRCYTQACQVLEAYYNQEKNSVNHYRIDTDNSRDAIISIDFLHEVQRCILQLNMDELVKKFQWVKTYYYKHSVQFEAQKEQYFYSVRNIIYNTMLYFSEKPDENGLLPAYDKSDSVDVMTEKLHRAAEWLIREVSARKKPKKDTCWEEILAFIETHFADTNTSVGMVCEELRISEKNLQGIMKEKTGDTFAVYLEKYRVDRAADLLLNTNHSNEQIAEEVGFIAKSTFYRAFNKRMGMSPKVFRK